MHSFSRSEDGYYWVGLVGVMVLEWGKPRRLINSGIFSGAHLNQTQLCGNDLQMLHCFQAKKKATVDPTQVVKIQMPTRCRTRIRVRMERSAKRGLIYNRRNGSATTNRTTRNVPTPTTNIKYAANELSARCCVLRVVSRNSHVRQGANSCRRRFLVT